MKYQKMIFREYSFQAKYDIQMTRKIGTLNSQAIYDMLGAGSTKPQDTAEERAKNIFNRFLRRKNLSKYIFEQFQMILFKGWTKTMTAH